MRERGSFDQNFSAEERTPSSRCFSPTDSPSPLIAIPNPMRVAYKNLWGSLSFFSKYLMEVKRKSQRSCRSGVCVYFHRRSMSFGFGSRHRSALLILTVLAALENHRINLTRGKVSCLQAGKPRFPITLARLRIRLGNP